MRKLAKRIPALFLVLLLLFGGSVVVYADGTFDNNPDLASAQPFDFDTVVSGRIEKQKTNDLGELYYYMVYELQAQESGYYRFSSTGGHWSEDDDFYLHVDIFSAGGVYLLEPYYHGFVAVFGDFLFSFYLEKDKTYYMSIYAARPGDFTVYAEPFDACNNLNNHNITLGYKQVLNINQVLEGTGYTADDLYGFGTSPLSNSPVSGPNPINSFYSRYSKSSVIYGAAYGTVLLRLDMIDASFTTIEVTVSYSSWDVFCYKYLFGWLWMNWKKPLTNPIDLFILYTK